jgi:predicted metal-dependent hydrolase
VIETFVQQNRHWIEKKKTELNERLHRKPLPQAIPLISGSKIPFRGSLVSLNIRHDEKGKAPLVRHEDKLWVILPPGTKPGQRDTTIKKALKAWFIEYLRIEVTKICAYFASMLRVRPTKIRLRRQKTRWGSCSSGGSINLNWHLVFLPPSILEYVVVHELCHLRHLDHSPQFWSLVASLLPDYQVRKKWLREYRPAFPADFWD